MSIDVQAEVQIWPRGACFHGSTQPAWRSCCLHCLLRRWPEPCRYHLATEPTFLTYTTCLAPHVDDLSSFPEFTCQLTVRLLPRETRPGFRPWAGGRPQVAVSTAGNGEPPMAHPLGSWGGHGGSKAGRGADLPEWERLCFHCG